MGRNGSETFRHSRNHSISVQMKSVSKTSDHKGASILVAQLAYNGLTNAVISPGSRNAPLTIAFDAHPDIDTHVVIDERSAAHVALGMALRTGRPAAVICTSGTAALNHGPAIAEAFHQRIPLISITADRPTTSIGKGHGQSVFQNYVFENNCLGCFLVDELIMNEEEIALVASEAYAVAKNGPVHINVPFEEPLYGLCDFIEFDFVESSVNSESELFIPEGMNREDTKILVIAGGLPFYKRGDESPRIAGICEKFSGFSGENIIHSGDLFTARLKGNWADELLPDTIITVGTPTLSKALRHAISEIDVEHFHVSLDGDGWDTFNKGCVTINADPYEWLKFFSQEVVQKSRFLSAWAEVKKSLYGSVINCDTPWSDLIAFETLFKNVPTHSTIHLSNSTSARYAQLVEAAEGVIIHSNRGVAGIDGCTSTAVGDAIVADKGHRVTLITGDIAFIYDLNGLATVGELPDNLRIVVINNGGGEIFRWLDGPEETGLVDKYFETKPKSSLKAAAAYCGLAYFCATDVESTIVGMELLNNTNGPSILEVKTDAHISTSIYKSILSKEA